MTSSEKKLSVNLAREEQIRKWIHSKKIDNLSLLQI